MIRIVIINMFLFGVIFAILGNAGMTYETWEFWAVLSGTIGLHINNAL